MHSDSRIKRDSLHLAARDGINAIIFHIFLPFLWDWRRKIELNGINQRPWSLTVNCLIGSHTFSLSLFLSVNTFLPVFLMGVIACCVYLILRLGSSCSKCADKHDRDCVSHCKRTRIVSRTFMRIKYTRLQRNHFICRNSLLTRSRNIESQIVSPDDTIFMYLYY